MFYQVQTAAGTILYIRQDCRVKIVVDISTLVENNRNPQDSIMPKPNVALTAAEWSVIKTVWDLEPCTAPAVQEKLFQQTAWTYSTVRTLLDRMATKGLLTAVKERNLTLYRSVVTRRQAQRGELLYALKHAFNGALTPLVQCLLETNEVSDEELAEIEKLIKTRTRVGRQPPRRPRTKGHEQ